MISSGKTDSFISYFLIRLLFFCLPIVWARAFGTDTMLNSGVEGAVHSCLLPDPVGRFQSFTVKCDVTCRFVTDAVYKAEDNPFLS